MTTLISPSIRGITPQFNVRDVVATAECYRDVWGFPIHGYWLDPPVFAIIVRDGFQMFFNKADPGTLRAPVQFRAAGSHGVGSSESRSRG